MSGPEETTIYNSNKDNTSYYSGMNKVFAHIAELTKVMNDGDRISLEDLKDKIAHSIGGMSRTKIGGLIKLYCAQNKEVIIESGAGGGLFKGGRKKRVDTRHRCPTCNQVLRTGFTTNEHNSIINEVISPL